jgi:hypothetical protein
MTKRTDSQNWSNRCWCGTSCISTWGAIGSGMRTSIGAAGSRDDIVPPFGAVQ